VLAILHGCNKEYHYIHSTLCLRKSANFSLFLYSSVKNNPILIFLVDRILKTFDVGCYKLTLVDRTWKTSLHYLVNADVFTWSTLRNLTTIVLSRNLNFRQPMSKKLLKVTVLCVYTPFRSFLIFVYYHALLAFSPSLHKELRQLARTLCCFIAFTSYTRSFSELSK